MDCSHCLASSNTQLKACVQPVPAHGLQRGTRAFNPQLAFRPAASSLHAFRCARSFHKLTRQQCHDVTRAATQSTGEASTALAPDMIKSKVLFVCKGNICRSPAAGSVMKAVVKRSGLAADFVIDSCGTGGSGHENWYKTDGKEHWEEHENRTVDDRMVDALKKRGYSPDSDSRPMEPEDFQKFDFVICMNQENIEEVHKAGQYWKDEAKKPIPGDWRNKVSLMTHYLVKSKYQGESEVPDPFHGGQDSFEKVLDLLEDACEGFVAHVESRKFATES